MELHGNIYSKSKLYKKFGNIYQIGGTRHYQLTEGYAKGTQAVDFNTGSGFNFTVIPDRGMDVSLASYKGVNLVYQTPNGEVNPAFYQPNGQEWLRTFFAGLFTTCGLTYFGHPGVDQGVELGLHGRHSVIPAKHVCDLSRWEDDEYILELSGVIEDSALFENKISMTRVIKSRIGQKSVLVRDRVENYGASPSPFTILYHINAGFPLLDRNSEFLITSSYIEPYDEASAKEVDNYDRFTDPVPNANELNYLHSVVGDDEGYAYAAMVNEELMGGLGLYIRFKVDTLPYLSEWKMLGCTDYVVGIEPCNVKCENRGVLRSEGTLPFLNPGEVRDLEVEFGVLEGEDEIEAFRRKIGGVLKNNLK